MCLSVPARVTAVDGRNARVEVYGLSKSVYLGVSGVEIGDWVLVYGPVAVSKLEANEAEETLSLLGRLSQNAGPPEE